MAKCPPEAAGRPRSAFTLIELLIVIAVISLLMAVLVPTLAIAKERARRITCRNNIHSFLIGIHTYASENDYALPSGLSDHGDDEHTPVLARATIDMLTEQIGNDRVMVCPWLRHQFEGPVGWDYGDYGYLFIGYNYLGGHEGTPWPQLGLAEDTWKSPQFVTDRSNVPLVTELNTWTQYMGHQMSFAPHGKRGPVDDFMKPTTGGMTSKEIGAVGGNNGFLDGSANWKDIEDMKIYRSSRGYGPDGCFSYW
ncbi:MAG: type II secretion system protein [Planctomycetota bacterium]|jgi:prepilin-type N-terminal cleavage/methylation domain-containing protein